MNANMKNKDNIALNAGPGPGAGLYDVAVIGGGLAGLTMTALLGAQGMPVCCIDRAPPPETLHETFDGRTTAVSWGSQKVLAAAGVWDALAREACPINTIQITDGDSPVLLDFDSEAVGNEPFGWILENRLIRKALHERLAALDTARLIAPAAVEDFTVDAEQVTVKLEEGRQIRARLVIGADGRGSFTREWLGIGARTWSYRQRALVCTVTHEHPHDHIAIENFRPEGPFAVLPMTDDPQGRPRSSVVWTEHGPDRASALHYSDEAFDAALQARFPAFYGDVALAGGRFAYPLGLVHAHDYIGPRMALVAEAAHGIHPIAGQGLNMGFRDIAALAALVTDAQADGDDIGAQVLLQRYQRQRRADNMGMAAATDTLNKLFSNNIPPVRLARRMGLRMVARLPAAKRFFMSQAMRRLDD